MVVAKLEKEARQSCTVSGESAEPSTQRPACEHQLQVGRFRCNGVRFRDALETLQTPCSITILAQEILLTKE